MPIVQSSKSWFNRLLGSVPPPSNSKDQNSWAEKNHAHHLIIYIIVQASVGFHAEEHHARTQPTKKYLRAFVAHRVLYSFVFNSLGSNAA
jgi:hypothetical protein